MPRLTSGSGVPAPETDLTTSGSTEKRLRELNALVVGVTVVVGLGFFALLFTGAAMVMDSLAEKKAIFLDMRDKVSEQNNNLEGQAEKITNLSNKVEELKTAITELKKQP